MNKDALLATIIGFGIGLLITGLVFMGPTIAKHFPAINLASLQLPKFLQNSGETKPTPTPQPGSGNLIIESPLADSIESKNELLVSGNTKSGSTVVIEGENDEVVVVANDKGAYAGSITLSEGKNTITVTSYDEVNIQTSQVVVYYTPETF